MANSPPSPDGSRRGWLARRWSRWRSTIGVLMADPRQAAPMARGWALAIWQSRGFGFYGFFYLLTVVWLEAANLIEDITEFSLPDGSYLGWLIEGLVNMAVEAAFVLAQALFWPVKVLEATGGWGFVIIAAAWLLFAHAIRPWAEQVFPELQLHAAEQGRKQQAKATRKTERAAARRALWRRITRQPVAPEPSNHADP